MFCERKFWNIIEIKTLNANTQNVLTFHDCNHRLYVQCTIVHLGPKVGKSIYLCKTGKHFQE
jgi:hypothetical protein